MGCFLFQVIGGLVLEEEIKFPVSIFRGFCYQYSKVIHWKHTWLYTRYLSTQLKINTYRNLAPDPYNYTDRNGACLFMHFAVYAHFSSFYTVRIRNGVHIPGCFIDLMHMFVTPLHASKSCHCVHILWKRGFFFALYTNHCVR